MSALIRTAATILLFLLVTPAGAESLERVKVFTGDVLLQGAQGGWLRIAVDDSADQSGRRTSQIFFLRSAEQDFPNLSQRWPQASVVVKSRQLEVQDGQRNVVLSFEMQQDEGREARRASDAGLLIRDGVELAQYFGGWEVPLDELQDQGFLLIDKIFQQYPGWNEGDSSSCASGGPGATSCSVEAAGVSCSISCSSPSYACCNFGPMSCKCAQ